MKKSVVIYIVLVFFLLAVAFVVLTFSAGRTTFFGKAAGSGVFSAGNSYVFGSPLSARVGGDKIRVTVFILDGQGKGIAGKRVTVNCRDSVSCQANGIVFSDVQPQTDSLGQSIFDISGSVAGQYELQASSEGIAIPQTVTISFN